MVGVILAGGLGRRMGGRDKAGLVLDGEPLLARAVQRALPQVDRLVVSSNTPPAALDCLGLPVIADTLPGRLGPLAGLLAAMRWMEAKEPEAPGLASFAVDTPFFPRDLVARLRSAQEAAGGALALAASLGRTHPVFGLWAARSADELERALVTEGLRKVEAWTDRHRTVVVPFEAEYLDPFTNINTSADLARAEIELARSRDAS